MNWLVRAVLATPRPYHPRHDLIAETCRHATQPQAYEQGGGLAGDDLDRLTDVDGSIRSMEAPAGQLTCPMLVPIAIDE